MATSTVSSSRYGLNDNKNSDVDGQPDASKEHDHAFLAEARLKSKSRMPSLTSQSVYHHNEINSSNHGPRIRSKSGSQTADQKNAWAEKIALQPPVLDSIESLRKSVEAYEREADENEWEELSRTHEDVVGLKRRVTGASQNLFTKGEKSTATGNFSSVALEYSKLLDVLMNHCPEYVSLAWGTIKVLLVANINNAQLKQKVEQHLVKIGEQLDFVNQLIYSVPTGKMIEAVALLYASFSNFLAKALKYYRKSKLSRAISAFAFPWDTKFQPIVDLIDDQLENIRGLAKAGLFRATLQNQQFLQLLRSGQDNIHHDVTKMKDEMQQGLQEMFSMFNAAWIQRFDELQQTLSPQSAFFAPDRGDTPPPVSLASGAGISEAQLHDMRDRAFPKLVRHTQQEQHLRARSRQLTAHDYQQSIGLLRDDKLKAWIETDQSRILWVNSWKAGPADWASAFALNLVDHAEQLPYVTSLVHLCQGRSATTPAFTVADIIRSLIFQMLERHLIRFNFTATTLVLEQCSSAGDNFDTLWDILQQIIFKAKANCIWTIVDAIDMLESDVSKTLLDLLDSLASQPDRAIKVFITSRNAGPSKGLSPLSANGSSLKTPSATITVTRARHRNLSTLLAKHSRRPGRLPDDVISSRYGVVTGKTQETDNSTVVGEDLDPFEESDSPDTFGREDLFASSEDDEPLGIHSHPRSRPPLWRNPESFLGDSDLDFNLEEAKDAQSESNFGSSKDSDGEDICAAPMVPPQTDEDLVDAADNHETAWDSDVSSP